MTRELLHDRLRRIPGVDRLLLEPRIAKWVGLTSRPFVVGEIQSLLAGVRDSIHSSDNDPLGTDPAERLAAALDERLRHALRPSLMPVINATGVILHTNLGRAPLSRAAQESLSALSAGYSNLEFDLERGGRSHRDRLLEAILRDVLGCEASAVVNNNAAAVFLILNTLAAGREVLVSRGELIEIGGSFRIPDIMARSGAILREVGTTNKTRIRDYENAIGPSTALLLRIHPSNYRIRGFTQRPSLEEMIRLSRQHHLPLVEDIGSGCLIDLRRFGIDEEPLARESLASGADLVCFSADKLLGGPQAGIIAGLRKWIEPIRENSLTRTFRVEKLVLGALEATLSSYRTGRAMAEIPVLRMITMAAGEGSARAAAFLEKSGTRLPEGSRLEMLDGSSVVGGGSCPDVQLPTKLIAVESDRLSADELEGRLRSHLPPVILRIDEDRALIDLRTVFPDQEDALLDALSTALRE